MKLNSVITNACCLIAGLLIMPLLIFSGCSAKEEAQISTPEYRKISASEAMEMIEGGDVVILDVRTEPEFAEAHVEGAVLLPDYDIALLAPEALPDKDETILVYCRSGRRSEAASRALVDMGYTGVFDFGGIIDWPYETVGGV